MEKLKEYWIALGMNDAHMSSIYESLTVLDEALVKACAHILQACAAHVWADDYIRISKESLGKRVEN